MSTSMVRIPDELKNELETMRQQLGLKTAYDVIEKLISIKDKQMQTISELQKAKNDEAGRREREDIYAGEKIKARFNEIREQLGLNPAKMTEFLLDLYESQTFISREAFASYVKLATG